MNEPNNLLIQENSDQIPSADQISAPPRWLQIVFKIWAVIGFLALGVMVIAITSSLLSSVKVLGELTEISISYSLVPYGLYAGAFVLVLVFLIPFWGAFKLRRWVLPILFVLSFLSVVNVLAILFREPLQFSVEFIFSFLWNVTIIMLTFLAFIFRHNFTGTFRKLVLQVIFFIFAIPTLAIGSLTLLFPDLPEISDSDLITSNIVLPPKEENAYFSLEKINEQIYEPTGDANKKYMEFLEGKAWDQAEIDLVLSKNENVLTEVRKSATLSYYQCPATAENISFTTMLCPLNYLRAGARVASLSGLSRAHNGDFQGAIEDVLVPVHIGQLLIQEPYITLIDYLVGDAMKRIGLKTLQIILATQDVPSKVLIPQIAEMEKYNQNESGLKNAFKLEYLSGKNGLAFVNKIDPNFYIQPNRFFTDMAEDTRQKMALTDAPCHLLNQAIKEHQKSFEGKLPKIVIWKLPFTRNAVFEVLKSVVMADLSTTQTKRCEADILVEQTRLQMALEAYKYDNNKYPISQSELVPKYLTRSILNPLTNNEFSFNKDTGEIMPSKQ